MKYWDVTKKLADSFESFALLHIDRLRFSHLIGCIKYALSHMPKDQNEHTNLLSKLAMDYNPSQKDPIATFLQTKEAPSNHLATKKLKREALYRRGFSCPLLKFLDPDEIEYAIRDIHEGLYGTHIGRHVLASKVDRVGYY
ncbi:hypothetical protein CR513_32172, partial [Mucuna pruriens]